ncbi:MAG: hypothetical protein FVQ85_04035 [Planctomycetes bacterium]|nr:hypothetical protein [Planctomycetota bacterium]
MKLYPYAEGDLLTERNTYFYTPYEGRKFIEAWKESRDSIVETIGEEVCPPLAEELISLEDMSKKAADGDLIEASVWLDSLYVPMATKGVEIWKDIAVYVDVLVKRFEITKRIHKAYVKGFRAHDKDACRDLSLYIRAAEVFEVAYDLSKALPYLNVLLKCLDTLCAYSSNLNESESGRLGRLIGLERKHITELAESRGVSI